MAARAKGSRTGRLSPLLSSGRQAALAQSAERLTRNEQVIGSIPIGGSQVVVRLSNVLPFLYVVFVDRVGEQVERSGGTRCNSAGRSP